MAFTLAEARQHVARDVKGGMSPDDPLVTDQINRAILGLLTAQYGKGEFGEWIVKLGTDGQSILLPPEIETADIMSFDGINGRDPLKIRMAWYRYLRDRCLASDIANCTPLEADDFGDGHVTDVKLTQPWRIMVYSERPMEAPIEPNDEGVKVYVRGKDGAGKEIYTQENDGHVQGAHLTIKNDRPTVSTYKDDRQITFQEITHFSKPETRWPVTIAAMDYSQTDVCTPQINWLPLATAMPWETSISRRLYRLASPAPKEYYCVHVFGRARYRPAKHPSDVLLIQNLEAIRQGVLRLEAESRGDIGSARHFDTASRAHLDEGLKRHNGTNEEELNFVYEPGSTIGGGLMNL